MRILSMRCAYYRGIPGSIGSMSDPAAATTDPTTQTVGIEYGFPATSSFDADSVARHAIPGGSTVTGRPSQAALDRLFLATVGGGVRRRPRSAGSHPLLDLALAQVLPERRRKAQP